MKKVEEFIRSNKRQLNYKRVLLVVVIIIIIILLAIFSIVIKHNHNKSEQMRIEATKKAEE